MKSLISPENQKVVDNGMTGSSGFPILKSALNEMAETSKEPYAMLNMINEEVAPFFAGQKNAAEVTKIIQSRVEIYVKENR